MIAPWLEFERNVAAALPCEGELVGRIDLDDAALHPMLVAKAGRPLARRIGQFVVARAVSSVLLSLALSLSVAYAESKKCLASKFIAKAWLPALDSSDGIAVIQKKPKDAIINVRIILDDMTMQEHEIWKSNK
jgi:hypothetical protein